MILDLLATNNWKRPVYFATTVGDDSYLGLQDYFQLEGLAYRLVPVKNPPSEKNRGEIGRIEPNLMYQNIMNKFKWGGVEKKSIYMDENNLRMTMNLRSSFSRLASELISREEKAKAIKVLDKLMQVLPENNVPYDYLMIGVADNYYKAGNTQQGDKILLRYADIIEKENNYYASQKRNIASQFKNDIERNMYIFSNIMQVASIAKRESIITKLKPRFERLQSNMPESSFNQSSED